jgi:hypothetical protein
VDLTHWRLPNLILLCFVCWMFGEISKPERAEPQVFTHHLCQRAWPTRKWSFAAFLVRPAAAAVHVPTFVPTVSFLAIAPPVCALFMG